MKKPKLLIVEDDEDIQLSMKWALAQDYEIFLAGNREQALELFQREEPPLVTLDLGLPPHPNSNVEGFRTLSELLAENPFAKIVIITGQEDNSAIGPALIIEGVAV